MKILKSTFDRFELRPRLTTGQIAIVVFEHYTKDASQKDINDIWGDWLYNKYHCQPSRHLSSSFNLWVLSKEGLCSTGFPDHDSMPGELLSRGRFNSICHSIMLDLDSLSEDRETPDAFASVLMPDAVNGGSGAGGAALTLNLKERKHGLEN
jgi:hypothetical protein